MKLKSILKIAGSLFFWALALVLLLFLGAALPIQNNYKIMAVLSGSMAPAIPTGSLVLVVPQSHYKTGEVVTFTGGQIPTTHRITEVRADNGQSFYSTKGDANNAADFGQISQKQILGKVFLSVPLAGYLVSLLKTKTGFFVLVGLPAIWLIISEIGKIRRELAKNNT